MSIFSYVCAEFHNKELQKWKDAFDECKTIEEFKDVLEKFKKVEFSE